MDGRGHLFISCSIESDSIQNWFLGVLPWRQCRLFFQDNHKEPCTQRELLLGGKMYLIHTYAKEGWPVLKKLTSNKWMFKTFWPKPLKPKNRFSFCPITFSMENSHAPATYRHFMLYWNLHLLLHYYRNSLAICYIILYWMTVEILTFYGLLV
jgi:hypothetical protein